MAGKKQSQPLVTSILPRSAFGISQTLLVSHWTACCLNAGRVQSTTTVTRTIRNTLLE